MGPFSQTPQYGYVGEQKKQAPVKVIVLIVAVIIVLIVGVSLVNAASKNNSVATPAQHLSAQLTNLSTLTAAAPKNLQSDDLQKINAETDIITDGVDADLANVLPKKTDKSIVKAESDVTETTALASAVLTGTYDAEYKTVLTQKLENASALLVEIAGKAPSASLRASYAHDNDDYQALLTNLAKVAL